MGKAGLLVHDFTFVQPVLAPFDRLPETTETASSGRTHAPRADNEHPKGEDLVRMTLTAATALLAVACLNAVAADDPKPVPVTAENFRRAESDLYFGNVVKDGGFGKFHHNRELAPIDRQPVIRLNRDTLYSAAVFDLDAGPVTITLPDAGKRFMSMQVIDEDQYCPAVFYGAGKHTLTREQIGTRYVIDGDSHARRSREPEGSRRGSQVTGRDQGRSRRLRQV